MYAIFFFFIFFEAHSTIIRRIILWLQTTRLRRIFLNIVIVDNLLQLGQLQIWLGLASIQSTYYIIFIKTLYFLNILKFISITVFN